MPTFRKKPIVIEAVQYFRDKAQTDPALINHPGIALCPKTDRDYVVTIHGERAHLTDGDWIIPEPKAGYYYPCKPDIFAATYDAVS